MFVFHKSQQNVLNVTFKEQRFIAVEKYFVIV